MRIAFTIILILLLAYGFFEARRWRSPEMAGVLTHGQKRRRRFALAALCVIALMVIGGSFFPTDHISHQEAAREVVYWALCFVFVALIPLIAAREFRETLKMQAMKDLRQDRDAAFKEMVETIAQSDLEAKRKTELPSRNGHG